MTAYNVQDKRQNTIMGVIMGFVKQLQKLTPHPDRPHHRGPLFISHAPEYAPSSEHDGVLGSMLLQGALGSIFTAATCKTFGNICQFLDSSSILECYSEYIKDTQEERDHINAHGRGTYARWSAKTIATAFNTHGKVTRQMQEFLNDLPERLKIEQIMGASLQELQTLRSKNHLHPAFALTA